MRKQFLYFGGVALIVLLDILWGGWGMGWHLLLAPTVLVVIATTLIYGPIVGAITAIIVGIIVGFYSAVGLWPQVVRFLATGGTAWLVSQRLVASRSTVSFLTAISLASLCAGISYLASDLLLSLFNHERIHLVVSVVSISTMLQSLTHPVILLLVWRAFGRGQYHHLTPSIGQAF